MRLSLRLRNRGLSISRICCFLPGWARTVQSLAMVAEVLHGAPFPFRDPARFSLAHGGKDRHRDTDIPVCARRETKETPMGQGWYGCAT